VGWTPTYADSQIIAFAMINYLFLGTINVSDHTACQGIQIEDWR
jgi:hypothetical protein